MEALLIIVLYVAKFAVLLFWVLDVCNLPFMDMFDTTYPLNGVFWFLFFLVAALTLPKISSKKSITFPWKVEDITFYSEEELTRWILNRRKEKEP